MLRNLLARRTLLTCERHHDSWLSVSGRSAWHSHKPQRVDAKRSLTSSTRQTTWKPFIWCQKTHIGGVRCQRGSRWSRTGKKVIEKSSSATASCARTLGERIQHSRWFKLLAPVRLNIVCFAPRDPTVIGQFVAAVRDEGKTFVTPTVLEGTAAVRAAFCNWRTDVGDVDIIWKSLVKAAESLL